MERAFQQEWSWARTHGLKGRISYFGRWLIDWLISVPREWIDVARLNKGKTMQTVLSDLVQDVRYGLGGFARRPTMTLVLTVTLGFGIGGVTAIDSVLRGTLFRGLPYPAADQIHLFSNDGSWAPRDVAAIEDGSSVLESVAAYHTSQVVVQAADGGVTAENGLVVSRDFFEVLGQSLYRGAGFQAADFTPDAPSSVVIAHSLWLELGGSPSTVGAYLSLDGSDVLVAGVASPGFYFPDPGTRIFRPVQLDPASGDRFLTLVTRVAPRATANTLTSESQRVTEVLGRSEEAGAQPLRLVPLRDAVFGQGSEPILLAAGALGLVLLMAVINVGTLLLAHTQQRMRELSVRSAIGASRSRLTRQLVTESALLGLLGATAALLFGTAGYGALIASLPIAPGDAALLTVGPRFMIVALTLGVAVGSMTGFAASLVVPAGTSPARGGSRLGSTRRATLIQNGLVISQIALSVALVGGAGVMIRSVGSLSQVDTGVAPGASVVLDVVAGAGDYPPAVRAELYRELRTGIAGLPATEAVGLTQKLPLRGAGWSTSVRDPGASDDPEFVPIRFVSPGYFEALGVPVLAGRSGMGSLDGEGGSPSAWVNQALADRMWPGQAPAGARQLSAWGADRQVVGVVGNVSEGGLTDERSPAIYLSLEQTPRFLSFVVIARPRPGAGGDYAATLQRWLRDTHPQLAIQSIVPFSDIEAAAQGDALLIMRLLVLIGTLALIVGAVGVHGVVSHWVSGRLRGWAVSLALGATPRSIWRAVLRRSVILTTVGVFFGLVLFAAGGAALESFVYGVERLDASTLLITALVMVVTGIAGATAPALRASRTDPMSLLKLQ